MCTVDASVAVSLGFLGIISMSPLYFAEFSTVGTLREVIFLGALDDEEFFVVEGSGSGGVAGSQTATNKSQ